MKKKNQIRYQAKGSNTYLAMALGLLGFGLFILNYYAAGALALATALPISFKTDGVDGDNLKMLEFLNKRMASINLDILNKEEIQVMVRTAMEKFEGLDLTKLKEFTQDDDKGLRSILLAQGAEIEKLKTLQKQAPQDNSIRAQLTAWVEANKTTLAQLRNKELGSAPTLTPLKLNLRAAITMTEAASLNGSAYLPRVGVLPGVVDLVRTQPTFWERLQKGATNLNPLVWVNKTNKQGNAAFIGEGVLKPLASFELETETSTPKKVAERMKVSTEMLADVDGLMSMIMGELKFEVDTAANTAVLTGTGVGVNPKGVTLYGSAFVQTGLEVIEPNDFDAIRAAIVQLAMMNFSQNLTAYVSPIDAGNMDMTKNSEGIYALPPFISNSGTIVKGVPVVEDNNIAEGYLLIGDFTKYKVLMYEAFNTQIGWENDDFSRNLVTIIGEMRFHQYFSSNHAGAIIYDTFANIKTAIIAAP